MDSSTIKYFVSGMTCSACSSHVEKAAKSVSGANEVSVNLLTNSMTVTGNAEPVQVIEAITKAGYGAKLAQADNSKASGNTHTSFADEKIAAAEKMKKTLYVSVVFLVLLMYVSMGHMVNLPLPSFLTGHNNAVTFGMVQFLLTLPILIANSRFYKTGFKTLIKGAPNMDSLIALGSGAAVAYGVFAIIRMGNGLAMGDMQLVMQYHSDLYFESAGTILTLITLGKYFEAQSKGKTSEAITRLINLAPKTAYVLQNEEEIEIPIDQVKIGDIIIVKPGSIVPTDGVIIDGASALNESTLTGESVPADKTVGDDVFASSVNTSGAFKFKATKVGEDTTLSQIIKLVEQASSSKAPIAKLADKVSGIFVPIVIAISIISGITWVALGQSAEFALSVSIAVLVISCPCALGLATPVAIMVGTGKGAENGILIKSGEALQQAHKITHVVFDKTGTVTNGKPAVTDIYCENKDENEFLSVALGLEQNSEHPMAHAIKDYAKQQSIPLPNIQNFKAEFGRGVQGYINNEMCFGGNLQFMQQNKVSITQNAQAHVSNYVSEGKTPLYFAKQNTLIGVIAVADTVKQTSATAVKTLNKLGIHVTMLTGDNEKTAKVIAAKIGVSDVQADVLPAQKEEKIRQLQSQNKVVAMVGDGVNDAPALVRADVGIAIGAGTDVAIESADIVLIKNDLSDVAHAIRLAKAVMRNIKQNLFWAFFYNTIGIPLAAGIFIPIWGIKLSPMFAAAAMSLSSICVVTNALRLRNFKKVNTIKINNNTDESMQHRQEAIAVSNSEIKQNINKKGEINMKTITLNIEGMMCNHCKNHVEKALNAINGVNAVVELEKNIAICNLSENINSSILITAVTDAGYKVIDITGE